MHIVRQDPPVNLLDAVKGTVTATPSYRVEFPEFLAEDIPAMPEGFVDQSWHNDSCPSFRHEGAELTIYVEAADPAARDYEGVCRFGLTMDGRDGQTDADRVYLYEGDDWNEVLRLVAENLSSQYAAPLATIDEGKKFIEELHAADRMFHFEDSPESIILMGGERDGDQFFTHAECRDLRRRVSELYTMDWSTVGHECPIGYALEVMDRDGE